jgi:serine/threonine protein kinase
MFLMDAVHGGELYDLYQREGLSGSEAHAKFYLASVVLAFEHMHKAHIIYRDLKPENLLLTEKGKLKVTDLGLAKIVVGKTYTTCGTPDYFAPEMIEKKGYTDALDWWTLGVLAYELMVGRTPFGEGQEVLVNVKKGILHESVSFPHNCLGAFEDLVKGLCHANPASRLPVKKGGAGNVKNHDWFKDFEWAKLEDGTLDAPFRPKVKSMKQVAKTKIPDDQMPTKAPFKPTRRVKINWPCCPKGPEEPEWDELFPTVDISLGMDKDKVKPKKRTSVIGAAAK